MTARTPITVHTFDRDGLDLSTVTPTASDVANGNVVPNRPGMFVDIKNTNSGSTPHDMTFALTGGRDGFDIQPRTKTIAAGKTYRMGPWPAESYSGQLKLNGNHAELTIAAYQPADD